MASSRTKKDGFQKKCLNRSITLLQQSSDKRDAQLFRYFGYKKVSDILKKELFI